MKSRMNIHTKRATPMLVLLLIMASAAMAQTVTPKAKATVLQAREAVDSALRSSLDQERWQMLQDYHLGT